MKNLYPDFYQAIQYSIIEYGQGMIPKQQDRLKNFKDKVNFIIGSAYEIPVREIQGVFISNELPDAFPVEKVTRIKGKIKQKFVTIENNEWVELWEEPTKDVTKHINKHHLKIKEKIEEPINLLAEKFQHRLDMALKKGAIITIDYGENKEVGQKDNLAVRCYGINSIWVHLVHEVKKNLYAPYKFPGEVDMTASINFKILENQAKSDGLIVAFSGLQRDLLAKSGFEAIVKQMEEFAEQKKSVEINNSIIENFKNSSDILNTEHFGDFYAQILLKAVNPSKIKFEESYLDYKPKLITG
jgi:SAM-dependent MidA family methyltransferase